MVVLGWVCDARPSRSPAHRDSKQIHSQKGDGKNRQIEYDYFERSTFKF